MNNQRILLLTLKLKQLNKKLDFEENENFGYSPNTPYFNNLIEQTLKIKEELKSLGIKNP